MWHRIQAADRLEAETFELVVDREQLGYLLSLCASEVARDGGARDLADAIAAALESDASGTAGES
jgi:hypothetical protein